MPRFSINLKEIGEVVSVFWATADTFIKRRLRAILLLIIISSVLSAVTPVVLKLIVDAVAGENDASVISPLLLIALYLLSQWASRAIGELRTFIHGQATQRIYRLFSDRLLSHVLHLPLRYHLDRQTGAIGSTLNNGLAGFQMLLQSSVFTFLPVLIEIGIVALVLLKIQHGIFVAIFFAALGCYAIAFGIGISRLREPARSASAAQIEAQAMLTDSVLSYETVKYFTAEQVVQGRLGVAFTRTESEWARFFKRRVWTGLWVATIFVCLLSVTLVYATYQVLHGRMTLGDFVLINTYVFQLARPIEMLGMALQQFSQGAAFVEKMLALFREEREAQPSDTHNHSIGPGRLEFQNVTAEYRDDQKILKGISFVLPAGQTLGLVGTSGAGKSTIGRLITRMIQPSSGQILIDDISIMELSPEELRQHIAVVPQDTILFNDTIGANIALGKNGASQSDIEYAARLANLHDFIMTLPDAYMTQVGERGVKLSGGEKQRIAIARAALRKPRIYIFDEATSSLDSGTERGIMTNLRDLSAGSTTLLIAHRLSTVIHADFIIVLHDGVIIEQGTHAALLKRNGRYASLWRAQHMYDISNSESVRKSVEA